ncbi:hypothetical protein [Streptomyces sp. NPDC055287]
MLNRVRAARVTCGDSSRWQNMKTRSTAAGAAALVAGLAAVLAGPAPSALAAQPEQPDRPARLLIALPDVGDESFQGLEKAIQY